MEKRGKPWINIWKNVEKRGKRGKTWENVEKRGKTWKNVGKRGKTWENVEKRGKPWKNVGKTLGKRWGNVEKRGNPLQKRGKAWKESRGEWNCCAVQAVWGVSGLDCYYTQVGLRSPKFAR